MITVIAYGGGADEMLAFDTLSFLNCNYKKYLNIHWERTIVDY